MIVSLGDTPVRAASDLARALEAHKPGDRIALTFDRHGQRSTTTVTVGEDPRRELLPVEQAGTQPSEAQRQFRQAWLSSQARNTF